MIIRILLLCLVFIVSNIMAEDTIPSWLDTIPPVLSVSPQKKYQSEIFHISIRSNEHAIIKYSFGKDEEMVQYTKPITVVSEGKNIIYYKAEDDVGNATKLDSAVFILDTKPPRIKIVPDDGLYDVITTVKFICDEPCKLFFKSDSLQQTDRKSIPDSIVVSDSLSGYVVAVDRAGNTTLSKKFSYVVDTANVDVTVKPKAGLYNELISVSFDVSPGATVYYTLDPLVPTEWFKKYKKEFTLPHGLSLLRYFAKSRAGKKSELKKASFIVDTIPPKIRSSVIRGASVDKIRLSTKETATIYWSKNENEALLDSANIYKGPILIRRTKRGYVKALARDRAGNISKLFVWEYRYDKTPPKVKPSHNSGTYTGSFYLHFKTNEPAKILYVMDSDSLNSSALMYSDKKGIRISKSGKTKILYMAIDEAGNKSKLKKLEFLLDASAPEIKEKIDGNGGKNNFLITLESKEPVSIYYEIGDKLPDEYSNRYSDPIEMHAGQLLKYIAIDSVGNRSKVYVMDDLQRPIVQAKPKGGVYTQRISVKLVSSMSTNLYFRILPDTEFVPFKDSIRFLREGIHKIEYYSITDAGVKSPIRRDEYNLDWTAPITSVTVKQGINDTVIVFFDCSEKASVYYTTDGTSPSFSKTVKIAGSKYFKSSDRIKVLRQKGHSLAYFAEDAAGNKSSVTVLDFFNPHVIPNIPDGIGIKYDHTLSVGLNSYDVRSNIYFERHGKTPTTESTLYESPITLLKSDTILAFVMDASGYKGSIDTFIYQIDMPASPQFTFSPETVYVNQDIYFDASATVDNENPIDKLTFRWMFDSKNSSVVEGIGKIHVSHKYSKVGWTTVKLEVVDTTLRSTFISKKVFVRGICPQNMSFVSMPNGHSFCIDKYEYPNISGKTPTNEVSWIQANMACLDNGKRLCTAKEWKYTCSSGDDFTYPYGNRYDDKKCPTASLIVQKSGTKRNCGEGFGTFDMIGNLWEWVADRDGVKALMLGGTYKYGKEAHCGLISYGNITVGNPNTGFRCCK